MRFCYQLHCFRAPMRPALFTRKRLLQLLQALFSTAVVARVLYRAAIRKGRKVKQSQIDTNGLMIFWQRFSLSLTGKDHIPALTLTLDRTGFDRACDLPMELDLDRANLRETHPIISSERVSTLRVGEAIIAIAALKPGIARLLTLLDSAEEVVKRFLHPPKHIL